MWMLDDVKVAESSTGGCMLRACGKKSTPFIFLSNFIPVFFQDFPL
jgi:hypothetical protein